MIVWEIAQDCNVFYILDSKIGYDCWEKKTFFCLDTGYL